MEVLNQHIALPVLREKGITLFVKREDQIHKEISGNKYRKLKYNIQEAKARGFGTLLTFGGAYSNHILATACAGFQEGLQTIGIIRGDEVALKWDQNPTLVKAKNFGMEFKFITREAYRHKNETIFLNSLQQEFGPCYVLPEGGTNALAIKGCQEILRETDAQFDIICCCVGTGGTLAGLINSSKPHQHILGFPALKGDFLQKDICNFVSKRNWKLQEGYHFGGYAKTTIELIDFINTFKAQTDIPLDPIYTGKMMYGILDLVRKDVFHKGISILAIHSGGLQGIEGMNKTLKAKDLPWIV